MECLLQVEHIRDRFAAFSRKLAAPLVAKI